MRWGADSDGSRETAVGLARPSRHIPGEHPLKCFEQKLRLTSAWTKVPKRVYVYAAGWSPSAFT
jgi:hypothetical protein